MSFAGLVVDYRDAARRHFLDANSLCDAGRLGNAGQLYGFAAECGVKALMVSCGASVNTMGTVLAPIREHHPQLRLKVLANLSMWVSGRGAAACYAALGNFNKFDDWCVDHRYWHLNSIPLASMDGWKAAAAEVMRALDDVV